jgi:hypothetical protein
MHRPSGIYCCQPDVLVPAGGHAVGDGVGRPAKRCVTRCILVQPETARPIFSGRRVAVQERVVRSSTTPLAARHAVQ